MLSGLQGATDLFDASRDGVPGFSFDGGRSGRRRHKIAVRWTSEGTQRGPLAGIAATGKRVNVANGRTIADAEYLEVLATRV